MVNGDAWTAGRLSQGAGHPEHSERVLGVAEFSKGHEPGGCCPGASGYPRPRSHFSFSVIGGNCAQAMPDCRLSASHIIACLHPLGSPLGS